MLHYQLVSNEEMLKYTHFHDYLKRDMSYAFSDSRHCFSWLSRHHMANQHDACSMVRN